YNNDYSLNELEIYDTSTNTWAIGANMPSARRALTSSTVGGKIYAIGGDNSNRYFSRVDIYSITSDHYPSNSLVFKNGTAKDLSIPNKTKLGVKYSQRVQFNSAYYFNKLAELVYKPMYFGNGQKWTKILN
ncbi:kelch repeat-containing protein, partial [Paenibacillus larvae]